APDLVLRSCRVCLSECVHGPSLDTQNRVHTPILVDYPTLLYTVRFGRLLPTQFPRRLTNVLFCKHLLGLCIVGFLFPVLFLFACSGWFVFPSPMLCCTYGQELPSHTTQQNPPKVVFTFVEGQ